MKNREELLSALQELRMDNTRKQKRGMHFIMASVCIWALISLIHFSTLPILTKNLYTFFCSAPLVPLAYALSRLLKIDFQNKENPLSGLGLLFTLNQILYILIAMWVYAAVPDKMLMVYAMIFGAHLMPFGWLFQSKTYYVFSVIISVAVLFLGLFYSASAVALFMLAAEVVFSGCLIVENREGWKE